MREKETERQSVLGFERFIVSEYLRLGSVDEIFRENKHKPLGISYPGVYHILDRWGVVRSLGRSNTPLTESVEFLVRVVEDKIPIETLYRKMPPSFRPTLATLHRIYRESKRIVKKEITERETRRWGTALVITPKDNPGKILIARDVSYKRLELGKPYGSLSLPMGFSKKGEKLKAILRILQQEVFSKMFLDNPVRFNKFAAELSRDKEPFMFLDIADVRVCVYHIVLPDKVSDESNFSSFKLKNYRYVLASEIPNLKREGFILRSGMVEIVKGYLDYQRSLEEQEKPATIYMDSIFNQKLWLLLAQEKKVA